MQHKIKRHLLLGRKAMTNLESILKSKEIILLTKVHIVKAKVFPVVTHGCERWTIRKAECWRCFWILVLEKTLKNSLDCRIKPVNPKGNQPWIFIGRTDAEAEAPFLWSPDVKSENEDHGIQKTKIMASGPITSWETDGKTVEIVSDFTFGGSKITADGDCSHEIKRCLLLGRKVMNNLIAYSKAETLLCQQKSV